MAMRYLVRPHRRIASRSTGRLMLRGGEVGSTHGRDVFASRREQGEFAKDFRLAAYSSPCDVRTYWVAKATGQHAKRCIC